MENIIIIVILAVAVLVGGRSTVKHFKGEGGCCGGGSVVKTKKKKLQNIIAKRTFHVEGMTCENCKNRVERVINEIDGASAVVNLRKKEVQVSMEKEIPTEKIQAVIEKAGYTVISVK